MTYLNEKLYWIPSQKLIQLQKRWGREAFTKADNVECRRNKSSQRATLLKAN